MLCCQLMPACKISDNRIKKRGNLTFNEANAYLLPSAKGLQKELGEGRGRPQRYFASKEEMDELVWKGEIPFETFRGLRKLGQIGTTRL